MSKFNVEERVGLTLASYSKDQERVYLVVPNGSHVPGLYGIPSAYLDDTIKALKKVQDQIKYAHHQVY